MYTDTEKVETVARTIAHSKPHYTIDRALLYFNMREPKHTPSTATELDAQNNPSIRSKANLDMATTAQSKPKLRTKKYRAIQRPDGIIVEHPRYRPADSSQTPTIRCEGNSVPSNYNGTQHKLGEEPRSSNTEHDLMGIGRSFSVVSADNIGSDVFIGHLGRGRAGYSETTCDDAYIHIVAGRSEQQQLYHGSTPMARFLGERGPWSSFSVQEAPEELSRSYTASAS